MILCIQSHWTTILRDECYLLQLSFLQNKKLKSQIYEQHNSISHKETKIILYDSAVIIGCPDFPKS